MTARTRACRPSAMRFRSGLAAKLAKGRTFREKAVYKRASMYFAVVPESSGKVKVLHGKFGWMGITGS